MTDAWLNILRDQVEQKGLTVAAAETGLSKTTVSLVLRHKYGAKTDRIREKVLAVYGADGLVDCPHLGLIDPAACAEHRRRAREIGLVAGNPQTLRQVKACQNCKLTEK